MLLTCGCAPGAVTQGDEASEPPGAVGGREPPVTPFHGHMVSFKLWPMGLFGSPVKDAATVESNRAFCRCHFAHSRSTLQCNRKKSGSFAAVSIDRIKPSHLVGAVPGGLPSISSNGEYCAPRAKVWGA